MMVSAIIVTRGDVDLYPVLNSLPPEWETVVWNNGAGEVSWSTPKGAGKVVGFTTAGADLSVYGRYAAIEHATHDLIYVQDDDVIVSDPQEIVWEWMRHALWNINLPAEGDNLTKPMNEVPLVANMPQEFRHDGYTDSCLVGFGACFHRDLPRQAFDRFGESNTMRNLAEFWRTCDVVFTTLTPRVLVDVAKVDREFASDPDRMYRQPEHVGERMRMLELARKVRDA